ncbi:uncharacterized protein LOC123676288 [Harmonia axyridis]|uniref:uncharacterized protein LOC123676288 n=1 Tax=Harmonia axyridis TaxID=115357 RepID=UPI001E278C03|nr:uncharacterized protein LOC123676288 [Harmonia axyridis]
MASNDGLSSQSGDENYQKEVLKVKCCGREQSVFVCVNCLRVIHKGCAKKMSGLEIISEGNVKCCENIYNGNSETSQQLVNLENDYLKKLITEIQDKNNVLTLSNKLLLEKIKLLEEGKYIEKIHNNEKEKKSTSQRSMNYAKATTSTVQEKPKVENTVKQGIRKPFNEQMTGENYKDVHMITPNMTQDNGSIKTSIENVNTRSVKNLPPDMEYKTVTYKKKRYHKRIGTAQNEDNNEFSGATRKVWIYLNRVKRTADQNIITTYLTKKKGFKQSDVKLL